MISFSEWMHYMELSRILQKDETGKSDSALILEKLLNSMVCGGTYNHELTENYKFIIPFCAIKSDNAIENMVSYLLEQSEEGVLIELIHKYCEEESVLKLIECEIKRRENINKTNKNDRSKFFKLLSQELKKQGYVKDSDFYNSIGMSRQTFSKIRSMLTNDYVPSRDTVIWIIIGLRLDLRSAERMMSAAGYSFRTYDQRECIIYERIKMGNYTLMDIEELLYMLELPPIASIA